MAKVYQLDKFIESDSQFRAYLQNNGDNSDAIRQTKKILMTGIDNLLTCKQKNCVVMHYFKNMSKKEIAQQLGVNPSTVTRSIQAAKKRLSILDVFL